MYVASLKDGVNVSEALKELDQSSLVEYVEPNYLMQPMSTPNDTYYDEVWGLENTGQSYRTRRLVLTNGTAGVDINWKATWDSDDFPTNEVIVAVLDTGVDYNHQDLVNQMWKNPGEIPGNGVDDDNNGFIDDVYGIDTHADDTDPMDEHAHGTHCAGTIAAEANNNYGIVGVNPYAKIMALRFIGANGGYASDAIDGIFYATDMGAQVINNSWGGGGYSQALQDAIDYANENGLLVLAASGNDGQMLSKYPASYDGVISVGATDSDDVKAYFSNWGPDLDLNAPGHDILSLRALGTLEEEEAEGLFVHPEDDTMLIFSGTSMACPNAVGAASLLVSQYPGLNTFLYREVLGAACSTNLFSLPENAEFLPNFGAGRIDVGATLAYTNESIFLESSVLGLGEGAFKGDAYNVGIKVGTWRGAASHVTIEIKDIDSQLTFNQTNATLPVIDANSVAEFNDEFTVTLRLSAESRESYSFTVVLKVDGNPVAEQTLEMTPVDFLLDGFTIMDFDHDGYKEIVGFYENQVFGYDHLGNPTWQKTLVTEAYASGVINITSGDFNGDGTGDVAVVFVTIDENFDFYPDAYI
jgi:subtilisin family serine protease